MGMRKEWPRRHCKDNPLILSFQCISPAQPYALVFSRPCILHMQLNDWNLIHTRVIKISFCGLWLLLLITLYQGFQISSPVVPYCHIRFTQKNFHRPGSGILAGEMKTTPRYGISS